MQTKSLGFFSVLALTVGTMVGVGILIAPNLLYKYGKYGHLAWPVSSAMCLGLAIMFSKLSQKTAASGPAGFTEKAFGHLASFQTSWVHWVGFTIAQAIICFSFAQYVGPYFNALFGADLTQYLSIGILWLITCTSCFLTIFSVSMVMLITALKVFVLLMIIIFGLPYLDIKTITTIPTLAESPLNSFIASMSVCLLTFIGLEMATLPSGNVKNPKFVVPLATIIATIIAAILYTMSYAVVGSAMSQDAIAASKLPMVDAANIFMGNWGGVMLTALGGLGFFATINGMLYGQAYILKHMSNLKVLPAALQKHSSAGFPVIAGFISAFVSTLLIILLNNKPAYLGNFGALSTCFVSIAYLWSVISFRHLGGGAVLWALNLVTVLAFLFGSLADNTHLIPLAILLYCANFFVYGLFVNDQKLENL